MCFRWVGYAGGPRLPRLVGWRGYLSAARIEPPGGERFEIVDGQSEPGRPGRAVMLTVEVGLVRDGQHKPLSRATTPMLSRSSLRTRPASGLGLPESQLVRP
jgi:hypothetical protein